MKITMQPGISLDGFIALPDGDSDSWIHPDDDARYSEAVARAGCLIVGHRTFEQYIDDFKARKNVTTFVCTSKPDQEDTETIKFLHGKPKEMIEKIKEYGFSELIVCGGGEINGLLAEAGLVDEIVVGVQPVVLGEGIPLFGSFHPDLKLEVLTTNQDVEGVVQIHYRVVR